MKQISSSSHPDGGRHSWAGLVLVWILGVWDWRDKATLSAVWEHKTLKEGSGFFCYRHWVILGLVLNFSACSDWLWFCLFGVQHSMKIPQNNPPVHSFPQQHWTQRLSMFWAKETSIGTRSSSAVTDLGWVIYFLLSFCFHFNLLIIELLETSLEFFSAWSNCIVEFLLSSLWKATEGLLGSRCLCSSLPRAWAFCGYVFFPNFLTLSRSRWV